MDFLRIVDAILASPGTLEEKKGGSALLSKHGALAAEALLRKLQAEEEPGRRKILLSLVLRLGEKAVPSILSRIEGQRWFFLRNLCFLLGEIGAPAGIPPLVGMLSAREPKVRREAVQALGKIRMPDPDAIAALGRTLLHEPFFSSSREDPVRIDAAIALSRIGGTEAIAFLHIGKSSRKKAVREQCEALLRTRGNGMKAQEVFLAILTDLVRSIQAAALYPETHQRVQEPLARLHRTVRNEAKRLGGSLSVGFFGDRIVVDQFPFHASTLGIGRLARRMASRGIEKVAIGEAVTFPEMKRFVYFVAGVGETDGSRPWKQISFGRIRGDAPAASPASGAGEALPAPQVLAGATDVLKDVLHSIAVKGPLGNVEEGRDIVAAVMKGLREEEFLIDRMIRLQARDDYTVAHSLNVCVMVVAQAARPGSLRSGDPGHRTGRAPARYREGTCPRGDPEQAGETGFRGVREDLAPSGPRGDPSPEDLPGKRSSRHRVLRTPHPLRPVRVSDPPLPGRSAPRFPDDPDRRRVRRPADVPAVSRESRPGDGPRDSPRGTGDGVRARVPRPLSPDGLLISIRRCRRGRRRRTSAPWPTLPKT